MFSLFRSKSAAVDTALVDQLIAFVRGTGLEVREAPTPADTFLPGLLIEQGQLVVDRRRLRYPGDILHEAGHLAVVPAAERAGLGSNIAHYRTESEAQGDEIAAQLWSYAAILAIGLPATVVFHSEGYHGHSEWLTGSYASGVYPGLPLLVWMGLTTAESFPQMTRWLRA
ncbi:hypothetical protein [Hymenobacter sp. CRA2]|uniref:hypothetical protein n=1 Tax=Hymenobacter sp. CRA2 TaxID=1955620 RepID=UPI00098F101E|nr:hypothetical protein [Hymenobacter sp. CRA2]OON68016.1 hypothetical protein B0919_15245 [Hymenobacter sp. CRA2]